MMTLTENRLNMPTQIQASTLEPRISSLETSVLALTGDIKTIANAVDSLRSLMLQSQKPQWGNLIAAVGVGIMIISAIGASFISPLATQINYHEKEFVNRAITLLDLQDRTRTLEANQMVEEKITKKEIDNLKEKLTYIAEVGSPKTRERLAIIEEKLNSHGK